ncbi:transformation transcription domain-associated protein, partial [Ichthyophthirius multifiliis]
MQLFENTLLKQNPFPNYNTQSKYVYLAEALCELLLEELDSNIGYIMHPEKVYLMYKSNLKWGQGQIYLERMHFQRDKYILNQKHYNLKNFETSGALDCISTIFEEMNETDYSNGLKSYLASSFELRRAIAILQQREWVEAQIFMKENAEVILTDTSHKLNKENLVYFDLVGDYSQVIDLAIFKSLFIECQKNLNKWDELSEYAEKTNNLQFNFECLFNTFNMVGLKKQLQTIGQNQINYENALKYHSHALVEFQRTTTDDTPNQKCEIINSISIAFFHILKEWTKLPKNVQNAHTKHLVQLQALVELEEGQRVRDNREQQNNLGLIIENQAKNAQSTINQWRERMPHKFENLTTWKCITDQRNVILTSIFSRLKTRTEQFLKQLQKNNARRTNQNPEGQTSINSTNTIENYIEQLLQYPDKIEKILAPYTDTKWNTLVFIKTQQIFGYNTIEKMPNMDERLHPEEIYLRAKLIASTFKYSESINNIKSSIELIEKQASSNQQEDFKIHKADLYRKRALLQWQNNKYVESTEDMQHSLQICENYYKTWKSWLDICFYNYLKRQNQEYWIRNVFQLIPNALKYKPYKNQMLFTYILFILTLDKQPFIDNIKLILQEIPKPQILLWIPSILSQLYNNNKTEDQELNQIFYKILEEISLKYPQCIFYYLRAFIDNKSENNNNNLNNQEGIYYVQKLYLNLKNSSHNSDLIKKMEIFSKVTTQLFLQNFEFENALRELNIILEDFQSPKDENQIWQLINKVSSFLKQYSQLYDNNINKFTFLTQKSSLYSLLSQIRTQIYAPLLKQYQETYQINPNLQKTGQSFTTEQLLLLSLNVQEIELPGQYIIQPNQIIFRDYQPLNHVTISSINKGIRVQFKSRGISRQLILNCSNNKQYIYEIQHGGVHSKKKGGDNFQNNQLRIQSIEQVQSIMNIIFNLNKETFIRHLQIKAPKKFCLAVFSDKNYFSQYLGHLQIMLVPVLSKTVISMQDICDEKTPSLNFQQYQDTFNTHLELLDINNDKNVNQKMKQLIPDTVLSDYLLQKTGDFMDYICLRKEITYNLSTAMFYNYFLGKSLSLSNIFICQQSGKAYINYENIEINEQSQIVIKNHHSIRLSRCISQFIGDLGIQGILAPAFISMAKALTRQ